MALGAIDAYEKLGVTESNVPAFLEWTAQTMGLKQCSSRSLRQQSIMTRRDRQGLWLSLPIWQPPGQHENIKFEDKKYVYLPYEKVTPDNVNEFVKDEQ